MSYKSQAQRDRCHHLMKEGKLDKEQVEKWDKECGDHTKLPKRLTPKKHTPEMKVWLTKNKPWML